MLCAHAMPQAIEFIERAGSKCNNNKITNIISPIVHVVWYVVCKDVLLIKAFLHASKRREESRKKSTI